MTCNDAIAATSSAQQLCTAVLEHTHAQAFFLPFKEAEIRDGSQTSSPSRELHRLSMRYPHGFSIRQKQMKHLITQTLTVVLALLVVFDD